MAGELQDTEGSKKLDRLGDTSCQTPQSFQVRGLLSAIDTGSSPAAVVMRVYKGR